MEDVVLSKTDQDQREVAQRNWNAYVRARDAGHLDYIKSAQKCEQFYLGNQWDPDVKKELEDQRRPALTVNMILPTVNTVLGEYSATRQEVRFKPMSREHEDTSFAYNKLYQQIMHANNFDDVERSMFMDGVICDRGYLDVRVNFDDNAQGDVSIEVDDNYDIIPDPEAKDYDPRKWNEVFKTRWLSLDDIKLEFGEDKAKQAASYVNVGLTFGHDSIEVVDNTFGDNHEMLLYGMGDPTAATEEQKIRKIRVVERQYRVFKRVQEFVDPSTGDKKIVPETWDEARVREFAARYGLQLHERKVKRVRWTVTADNVVLHDDWSPYNHFTVVPYFPYFRRGSPMGLVRNLLSPQEMLNKVESQQLHIVNTTANSGWIVEENSLANMTEDELAARGAETGLVLVKRQGREAPEKIQPNQIPAGLDRVGQKSMFNIERISGVNDGMTGMVRADISGVALQQKQQRGVLQLQQVFDNLQRTRQILAEVVLDLVQQFYNEGRVLRLTYEDGADAEDMVVNQIQPDGTVFNDLSSGRYDVVVSSVPARDTQNDHEFAQAMAMRDAGVAVPDDKVVSYSNLTDKQDVAKRLRIQQGVEPPTPEEQQKLQVQEQIALADQQLELEKKKAEIRELQSRAIKNEAQAEDTVSGQNARHQQSLEQKTAVSFSNDSLRRQLAELSAQTQLIMKQLDIAASEEQAALVKKEPAEKGDN